MKSARPWIDTPLLCPSTCLSPASLPVSHLLSPGKSAIFSTSVERKEGPVAWRKVEGKQRGERPERETIIAEFSRFTTRRQFRRWLDPHFFLSLFHTKEWFHFSFFNFYNSSRFVLHPRPVARSGSGDDSKKISKSRNFCLIRVANLSLVFLRKFRYFQEFLFNSKRSYIHKSTNHEKSILQTKNFYNLTKFYCILIFLRELNFFRDVTKLPKYLKCLVLTNCDKCSLSLEKIKKLKKFKKKTNIIWNFH